MTKNRLVAGAFVILLLAIGFNTWQGLDNARSIGSTATKTCLVQSRGLSAQPHLTRAMGDIATLLTPPPNQKIPPGQKKEYLILGDLRSNLGAYVAIEGEQPKHRSC